MQLKDSKLFRHKTYINGQWLDADGGQSIKVNNPATNEILGTVPKMGAATRRTRRAIEAADKALPGLAWVDRQGAWKQVACAGRADDPENQDDLGLLMTLEQGKASRWPRPRARLRMPLPLLRPSRKKPSASTAM
ncbi:aldehyde dehydrogenase family protein [Pseudomonas syringae]|uniref:aldehyde dehydrogenase family protein n=1 Tax=Pseudomonas syringae TaxID=317 RepID=UPI003F758548